MERKRQLPSVSSTSFCDTERIRFVWPINTPLVIRSTTKSWNWCETTTSWTQESHDGRYLQRILHVVPYQTNGTVDGDPFKKWAAQGNAISLGKYYTTEEKGGSIALVAPPPPALLEVPGAKYRVVSTPVAVYSIPGSQSQLAEDSLANNLAARDLKEKEKELQKLPKKKRPDIDTFQSDPGAKDGTATDEQGASSLPKLVHLVPGSGFELYIDEHGTFMEGCVLPQSVQELPFILAGWSGSSAREGMENVRDGENYVEYWNDNRPVEVEATDSQRSDSPTIKVKALRKALEQHITAKKPWPSFCCPSLLGDDELQALGEIGLSCPTAGLWVMGALAVAVSKAEKKSIAANELRKKLWDMVPPLTLVDPSFFTECPDLRAPAPWAYRYATVQGRNDVRGFLRNLWEVSEHYWDFSVSVSPD